MHNGYVLLYTDIYTYIQTYIFIGKSMIMLVNAKCYPVSTKLSPCQPCLYDVGTTSMPLILCWYYANPVLTMLSLSPYHVL